MRGHSTDAFASDFTRRSLHVTAHSVLQCNELLFHDIFTEHALYKIKNTVNTECKNDHIQILQCQQDSLNHTPFQKNKINKKTADSTEEGRCQHSSRASHSTECYNLCSESHHCTCQDVLQHTPAALPALGTKQGAWVCSLAPGAHTSENSSYVRLGIRCQFLMRKAIKSLHKVSLSERTLYTIYHLFSSEKYLSTCHLMSGNRATTEYM